MTDTPPTAAPEDMDDATLMEAFGFDDFFHDEEYEDARRLETICDRDDGHAANMGASLPIAAAVAYGVAQHVWRELPDIDLVPLAIVGVSGFVGVVFASTAGEGTTARMHMLAGARDRVRTKGESLEVAASRALRTNQMKTFIKYAGAAVAVAAVTQGAWVGGRAAITALTPAPVAAGLTR